MYRVSIETIARWEKDAPTSEREARRPLVTAIPPVRRFADVVRATVKTMEQAGFGGNDLIARTLAPAGWKLSARTVGRIRKERFPIPHLPIAAPMVRRAVRARYPNHVWMVDLTDVRGLFGIVAFKVGAVFDVFSRMPLSIRVFSRQPSSTDIVRLVSGTARRHGRPVHFVSDRARCFTARAFRHRLRRLGVRQRFGAVGRKGSIALIERLWRTLKEALGLKLLRPLIAEDLRRKVELDLIHYWLVFLAILIGLPTTRYANSHASPAASILQNVAKPVTGLPDPLLVNARLPIAIPNHPTLQRGPTCASTA